MGLFGKIKDAKSNGGGIFFLPGTYELECRANKSGKTREDRPYFVAEFTILASTNPERPVGTSVSFMVMMDKYLETALGNVKGYVAALYDVPEDEVDEAGVEALISADNPGAGLKCRATASNTKTKKGGDFTKVEFSPFEKKAKTEA
jgi:hypothetical protein